MAASSTDRYASAHSFAVAAAVLTKEPQRWVECRACFRNVWRSADARPRGGDVLRSFDADLHTASDFLAAWLDVAPELDDEARSAFERYYKGYMNRFDSYIRHSYDRRLEPLLSRIPPGSRVLKVGCGCGSECLYLASLGHEVTGLDLNKARLHAARERRLLLEELSGRPPVGNDRKFPICNDPKFLTLGLSLKAYRAVLLALPTERDRCADVQMGDQDVVEALSGPGRLEGGAVEAVRGEPSDDPQLGRYRPTGPGSGGRCARVFAPSAGGPQADPLQGNHRRPS